MLKSWNGKRTKEEKGGSKQERRGFNFSTLHQVVQEGGDECEDSDVDVNLGDG